jgi:SAM-dependent methyltransferase
MLKDKNDLLKGLIEERWGSKTSLDVHKYIASYYMREISLEGKKILDIGCGSGLLLSTSCIVSDPAMAVGVDKYKGEGSPLSDYDFIRKTMSVLSLPNLKLVIGDASELPFRDKTFDLIYTSHCLHHIYESRTRFVDAEDKEQQEIIRLFREIKGSLSENGVFVIIEVPRYSFLRLARIFGMFKDTNFRTKQEPVDWVYALKRAGFKSFKIKYHTPYPFRFFGKVLSARFGRYLVSGQYYILAYV